MSATTKNRIMIHTESMKHVCGRGTRGTGGPLASEGAEQMGREHRALSGKQEVQQQEWVEEQQEERRG